jgi:CBS domain containing-hemolysin-like protein
VSTGTALLLAALLLAANAFFVGAEFALISARRTAVERRAATRAGRVTLHAMERVSLMLAGAQLGVTVCSLGLGALAEPAVAHLLEPVFAALHLPGSVRQPLAFALALAVVVFLHVVVGEMVPKNLTLAGPDRAALVLGPPLAGLVLVLKPVIVTLNALANLGLRILRVEPRNEVTSAFTREEVAGLLAESRREGLLEPGREQLLVEALAFEQRTVATVLVPPSSLVTVPPSVTAAEVEELVARTGYSRFPVRDGADLTGYVHVKDVLGTPDRDRDRPMDPAVVRALPEVGADTPLRLALRQMQTTGAHLTRVTDGSGRLIGVAMLEDALEELVGEITDATQR